MISDLERRLWLAEIRSQHLEQGAEAARKTGINNLQWLAQLWAMEKIATAPTCTASYSGTVDGCGAGALAGATITVKNGGGTVLDTQTSDGSGNYSGSATITSPMESVNIEISASGYSTTTLSETFSCGSNPLGTTTLTVGAAPTCCATFTGAVHNCDGSGNASATVVAKISGVTVYSGTTDGSGNISGFCELSSGTSTAVDFTITATSARFVVYTHTYTLNCCANNLGAINLVAATGYVCCSACPLPISTTLHLTDPAVGMITLTYNIANSPGPWQGSATYSYPGLSTGTNCVPTANSCPATTVTVIYGISCSSFAPGGTFDVSYSSHPGGCPGNGAPHTQTDVFPSLTSLTCPTSFAATYVLGSPCPGVGTFLWQLWGTNSVTFTLSE